MIWNVADVQLEGNTAADIRRIAEKIAEINSQLRAVLNGIERNVELKMENGE